MTETAARMGAGAGGTRNIAGNNHPLIELERDLADLHGKPAALVFTSGYVSNATGIATIAQLLPNCLILSDALNHNSMIEGVKRAGCDKQIWRHSRIFGFAHRYGPIENGRLTFPRSQLSLRYDLYAQGFRPRLDRYYGLPSQGLIEHVMTHSGASTPAAGPFLRLCVMHSGIARGFLLRGERRITLGQICFSKRLSLLGLASRLRNQFRGTRLRGEFTITRLLCGFTPGSAGDTRVINGCSFKALLFDSRGFVSGTKLFKHRFFDVGGSIPALKKVGASEPAHSYS